MERPSRKAVWSRETCLEVRSLHHGFLHYTDGSTRLLKETGRFSAAPVFVVGIYSGPDQLGEGFGSSLSMAEFRVRNPSPTTHIRFLTKTLGG